MTPHRALWGLAAVLLVMAAGRAAAQPVASAAPQIEVTPGSLPCPQQLRVSESPRPFWVPTSFWPVVESLGDLMILCIESMEGPVVVTVRATAAGRKIGTMDAPPLEEIAARLAPPAATASFGALSVPRPVLSVAGDDLVVKVGEAQVGISLGLVREGACAHEYLAAMVPKGTAELAPLAAGFYPTVIRGEKEAYGCYDTKDGYVTFAVSPASAAPDVAEVLVELRDVMFRRYGPADGTLTGSGRSMRWPDPASTIKWKGVDARRFGLGGGVALISTAGLGGPGYTRYVIGVEPGPCTGTAQAPDAVADPLFPDEVGQVWLEPDRRRQRWTAWACLAYRGLEARVAVIGPVGSTGPPEAHDEAVALRATVAAIARGYGVDVDGKPGVKPYQPRKERRIAAMGGVYLGGLTFGPPDASGERRYGGLLGAHLRGGALDGFGRAMSLAVELGVGAGDFIGELRVGAGVSGAVGGVVLTASVGGAVGSTGPAAPVDVFGEVGLLLPAGRSMMSLTAMRTVGISGLDHDRVQLWFMPPGMSFSSEDDPDDRTEGSFMFGARFMDYGDAGDAFLMTVGIGFSGAD